MYASSSTRSTAHRIDLRSDTVTKPCAAMRAVMAAAEVGDDVYGEDPTVRALESRVAEMAGMEAGLFVPSGTQSNLIALMCHCNRGDEVIVGADYHTFVYEAGGVAAVGGIMPNPLPTDSNGGLSVEQVKAAIKPDTTWFAQARLLALENTVSGQIQAPEHIDALCRTAADHGLAVHLDGARIWNAMVALGVPLARLSSSLDSLSVCLSKGLGAPVGSVLCGRRDFIHKAARIRKMLGGGMRQAGVLAACGLFALEHNLARLAQDHANARCLAEGLADIDRLTVHPGDTNMLFLEAEEPDRAPLVAHLAGHGILVGPPAQRIRIVTHLDISEDDIRDTIDVIRQYYE